MEAPVWFSVEYHFESSGGKNDSYISVFFLFKPLFLHAPLFSCTVNAITTSLLQLLVAMCCVGANGSTCSKLWNKFPGVSYVFSSSCSPLKGRLWSDRLASLDICRLASGRQEAERKLQHTLQTDRWDTEQKILLLVFYLSTQTYFIFLPRHQGCSFIPLDVTKSHNSLSSAVKKKKKKKSCWFQVAESDQRRPSRMRPTKTSWVFTWHQSNAKTTRAAEPHRIPPRQGERSDD